MWRWDVDPQLLDCTLPKIVLQPIIENAAIHGVFERADSTGDIEIIGRLEDGDIRLSVTDNGVGMALETVAANFGPGYGLSCTSQVNVGTGERAGDIVWLSIWPAF
ncbi:MAG: hypothetical protein HFF17_05825 [Oscillospiraceae bacterium]|nr:hypothetical protein [Oscillospiraceae bacterium]